MQRCPVREPGTHFSLMLPDTAEQSEVARWASWGKPQEASYTCHSHACEQNTGKALFTLIS